MSWLTSEYYVLLVSAAQAAEQAAAFERIKPGDVEAVNEFKRTSLEAQKRLIAYCRVHMAELTYHLERDLPE